MTLVKGNYKRTAMDNQSSRLGLTIAAVSALAAVVAAIGTVYQQTRPQEIVVLSYQTREEKELIAKAKEAREEIEKLAQRKQALEMEISKLEESQRQIAAEVRALVSSRVPSAPWYATAFKTIAIYFLLWMSVFLSIGVLILDVVSLLFGHWFPFLKSLWAFVWDTATIQWFWAPSRWLGIVAGGMLFVLLGGIPVLVKEELTICRRDPASKRAG
jgi:hypothetical protein